ARARAGAAGHEPGARGEQHAAVRDEVECRPLIREDERVAHGKRRHAADAEPQAPGDRRQGAEQSQRVGPRLGAETVADPDRAEERARVGLRGQGEHLRHGGDAEEDPSLRQREADGSHFAAVAHWAIWIRATRLYFAFPSGLKIDASPSLISNQSLPNASRMFGLWVTTS